MSDPNTPRTAADIEAELASIQDPVETLEPIDSPADSPAIAAAREAEATATRKGWVPKDKYTGDPAKWVDARTFIDRGEKFNSNLQREVAALRKQIEGFEGTKKAFAKFHEETIAKKDAELKATITELRVQRSAAIRDGDDEGAVALEDRIESLRDQQKEVKAIPAAVAGDEPAAAGPNAQDPVLLEWIEDGNSWFKDDTQLRDYAVKVGESLIKGGETLRGRKFLDKVAGLMKEEFPRKFRVADDSAPRGNRQNPVEGGGNGGNGSGNSGNGGVAGKSELDLPAEDRALMRQFIKEGWTTKEKFLSSYFSR